MIKELYEKTNSSYEIALSRMQNDDRIKKYLMFFLEDTSFNELKKAIISNNCDEAFKAAHTLKGVCQNMAFTALGKIVEQLTEELRAGNFEQALNSFPEVENLYTQLIDEIKMIV